MFDLTKFVILGYQLKTRVEQLNDNPPDSLEEYTALAEEIEGLLAKIKGERQSPDFDTAAFKAGRAEALKGYLASDADLDVLPPIVKPPDPKPAEFPYFTVITFDPRADARLVATDQTWQAQGSPTHWYVSDGKIGGGRPRNPPSQFDPEIAGVDDPSWKLVPR